MIALTSILDFIVDGDLVGKPYFQDVVNGIIAEATKNLPEESKPRQRCEIYKRAYDHMLHGGSVQMLDFDSTHKNLIIRTVPPV